MKYGLGRIACQNYGGNLTVRRRDLLRRGSDLHFKLKPWKALPTETASECRQRSAGRSVGDRSARRIVMDDTWFGAAIAYESCGA